jgi:hypothetical protein
MTPIMQECGLVGEAFPEHVPLFIHSNQINKERTDMKNGVEGKQREWTQVVYRAREDEQFKNRLLQDPIGVLKESGIEFPDGYTVTIVEGGEDVHGIKIEPVEGKENDIAITLPLAASLELTDEDLKHVSGGICWSYCIVDCPTLYDSCHTMHVNPQITD